MAEKYTLIPEQLFESQDAFIAHVKRFAVENGFNVRLDDVERDKGGVIRKRDIVCSSEGAPRGKDARREDSASRSDVDVDEPPASRAGTLVAHSGAHRRKSMKTGCRWLARASRQQSGMWKIIMLRLEHNHALTAHYDMLFAPSACTTVRSGDSGSITQAAQAAQSAVENGTYGAGPSLEFKNLFLQMSAACADLCWAAARRPETIPEVLGEIRRLNQHLDKPSKQHSAGALPPISEDDPAGALADAISDADGLVMMGHQQSVVETPAQVIAQSQQSRAEQSPELNAPQPAAQQDSAQSGTALPAPPAVSVASPPTGPVKRSRGRPRKNPLGTDGKPAKSRRKQSAKSQQQQQQQQQSQAQQHIAHLTPTPASLASLSQQIISQNAAAASSPNSAQQLWDIQQQQQQQQRAPIQMQQRPWDTQLKSPAQAQQQQQSQQPFLNIPPHLQAPYAAAATQAAAAAAAVYHYPQQHYHDDHQFYRQHADAASAASQPATAMSHLVLPNASAVGYHGQLARMQPPQQPASAPVSDSASHHQQQQQRAPMFHLNPSSMHAAQMGRDPSAAQIGYFLQHSLD
ncbi:hypothetical protein GGF46_004693 [Coemansia sp. RSA 552]|nr:hypothetical protein GGF46_004693 [Coemansia sp. RSA 552]